VDDDGGADYNLVLVQKSGNTYTLRSPGIIDYETVGTSKVITVTITATDDMYTRTCTCDTALAACTDKLDFCTTAAPAATGTVLVTILDVNEAFTVASTASTTVLEGVAQGEKCIASRVRDLTRSSTDTNIYPNISLFCFCSVSVLFVFSFCSLSVLFLFSFCSFSVLSLFSFCSLSVLFLFSLLFSLLSLFSLCSP